MCHVSIAMPPFAAPAPPTTASASSTLLTFTSKGMISYTTFASVCFAASAQSSPKPSVTCEREAGVPGMLPTLM